MNKKKIKFFRFKTTIVNKCENKKTFIQLGQRNNPIINKLMPFKIDSNFFHCSHWFHDLNFLILTFGRSSKLANQMFQKNTN